MHSVVCGISIYGHDVQDANDTSIPADVAEKILRFARGAVAAGWMRNKAYVNIGAVTMGIAGSFCDADVLQKYFGIRAEWLMRLRFFAVSLSEFMITKSIERRHLHG